MNKHQVDGVIEHHICYINYLVLQKLIQTNSSQWNNIEQEQEQNEHDEQQTD